MVESQRPEQVPFDLADELHLKFDAVAVAYRRAMRAEGSRRRGLLSPSRAEVHDPVRLPGLAAVGGEGLLPARRRRVVTPDQVKRTRIGRPSNVSSPSKIADVAARTSRRPAGRARRGGGCRPSRSTSAASPGRRSGTTCRRSRRRGRCGTRPRCRGRRGSAGRRSSPRTPPTRPSPPAARAAAGCGRFQRPIKKSKSLGARQRWLRAVCSCRPPRSLVTRSTAIREIGRFPPSICA